MDEELIKRWNKKVSPNDLVYYLGDFSLKSNIDKYLNQLNGEIFFLDCRFHHDKHWQKKFKGFLPSIHCIEIQNKYFVLSHFPLLEWERKNYGSIHLHGHSHGKLKYHERAIDIGVDCWNFYPISLDEILKLVA